MLIWSMRAASTAAIDQAIACCPYALCQDFAALGGQELGIAQAADAVAGVENHGGSDHGAEQRSAANLVHAGNQARAGFP